MRNKHLRLITIIILLTSMLTLGGCKSARLVWIDDGDTIAILKGNQQEKTTAENNGSGSSKDVATVEDPSAQTEKEDVVTIPSSLGSLVLDDGFVRTERAIEAYIVNYFLTEYSIDELKEGALKGMVEALNDPYTTWYTKEEFDRMMEATSGVFSGIGVVCSMTATDYKKVILSVMKDGPAEKAGIRPGDVIYKVNGEDVLEKDLNYTVSLMRGPVDTEVTVTMLRDGEAIDFTMIRALIESITVGYEMLRDDIGYIAVSEFESITSKHFKQAVDDLEAQNMKGLIIDLRNNGGGIVEAAREMLEYLIPKGVLFYIQGNDGWKDNYYSNTDKDLKVPCVILMNENSASASEIFAGVMQEKGYAKIMGVQSFGKGIVQSIISLSDGSGLALTTAYHYTENGKCIHKIGITPDIVVELDESLKSYSTITMDQDNQLQAAIDYLVENK